MTIYFEDVSNWQNGMSITGACAATAKASEGTGYRDPDYAGYRAQATAMGIPFAGYHFLHNGSVAAQAALAFEMVGASTPLMLDVEVVQGQPDPTYADVTGFVAAYRALGGRVTLLYLPEWFWSGHWGSPDLTPLANLGLALISSDYTTYSDTGPGWAPYGGVTPTFWQYTSTATVNGQPNVDLNAYRGTVEQLRAIFEGTSTVEVEMGWQFMRYGDSGEAIRYLQQQLRDAGAVIEVTGTYDDPTAKAVVDLQLVGADNSGHTVGDTEQIRLDDLRFQRRITAVGVATLPAGTKFTAVTE